MAMPSIKQQSLPIDRLVLEQDFQTSARTSIHRKQASVPLRLLIEKGFIQGSVLNFGKGRCSADSDAIKAVTGNCTDYDYTYAPLDLKLLGSFFNVVYIGYVANTLPLRARSVVYQQVADATRKKDGKAYFAVRSDKDKGIKGEPFIDHDGAGNSVADGVVTSKGTYQVGFTPDQLCSELVEYFESVEVVAYKAGYLVVGCSH